MAKFDGKNMIATFGTWTLDGLTQVQFDSNADIIEEPISGQTYKEQIVGIPTATFSLDGLLDDVTPEPVGFLNAITPGNTGTYSFDSNRNSTFAPDFSGVAQVRNRSITFPAEGFVAWSLEVAITGGTLTID